MRRLIAAATAALAATALPALADPDPADWDAVLDEARGQTVYWNAWGGSDVVNGFIDWVGAEAEERFGVTVEHVKLSDTAEAVTRVLSEKTAGKDEGGAIDLVWINGENFAAMKESDLLFGPYAEALPNWQYLDPQENAALTADFTVPTEGMESPWGMAQLVFYHDSARLPEPPRSMPALLDWLEENPGRFTFPQPPDFLGATFLKQALIELTPDMDALSRPVSEADYDRVTAPLWDYMDRLAPNLWRQGRAYPQNATRLIQLMADNEIDVGFEFNPNAAANAIANNQLPGTVRSHVHEGGTLGNASFVAIPFNANAMAGAMVVANLLLSPEAQARMSDPDVWGLGTVLALDKLPEEARAEFEAVERGPATLSPEELGPTLPEPHPSWMERLEEDWTARYGVAP
ncbi:ABC transporter substrate-binding protein [Salipiger mucosus]|uniref:ABC transporter, periplasmic substrate-binding protein YnjB n=1 Tax=Salipiger mucosus DSM 16094 TaxID=1123237 RepID=S9QI95_9RHOB|nr:ABC transporter substrate-binding protein [Salipiger mucosus]EPX79537.1 ABC transporter, periplasmic substrate-binding protein YnjB [Salipiger mucosus DSM 16094]